MIRPSILITFFLMTLFYFGNANAFDPKFRDCTTCNLKDVQGLPNARSIEVLSKVMKSSYQSDDFQTYLQTYCMQFEVISNAYAFKKEIIETMKKTPYKLDQYWTQAECRATKMGATLSPIIHLAAEDAFRTRWLETLYTYFKDTNDLKTWSKVVSSKDTNGRTVLDYIVYLNNRKQYRSEEKEDVNGLIKFLCEKGATFSIEKNQKCPLSI